MEFIQYWKIIRKSLWLILLLMVAGPALAFLYTARQPAKYTSSATLLLNPAVPNSLVPFVSNTTLAPDMADTYTELMRSQSFLESVAKELPFEASPGDIAGSISTQLVPNTLFYKISAQMNDPQKAQQLVHTVVTVFLSANAKQQADAQKNSDSAKEEARTQLQTKLQYLGDQIKSYQSKIADTEALPQSTGRDDQLLQLRGQLVTLQQSETEAIVALAQISNTNTHEDSALVIDDARPGTRVSSGLTTNVELALAACLVLGLCLAFLRDALDYSVQSAQQVEQLLGVTPAAIIGVSNSTSRRTLRLGRWILLGGQSNRAGAPRGSRSAEHLVTLQDPGSQEAESFRTLRTNIQFASVDNAIKSLVITSPGIEEGKTFTAANLAVIMAQAGKRVILVDADLRNPGIHKAFGIPNTTGFTNIIYDRATNINAAARTVMGVQNLAVITAGLLPSNPSELLNTQQAAKLMSQLTQQSDIVIYDSPPMDLVTDPLIIAARADAVVLVIKAGSTRRDVLPRVKQSLRNASINVLLPVLNQVRSSSMHGRYLNSYYRPDNGRTEQLPLTAHLIHNNGKEPKEGTPKEINLPVD